MAANDIPTAAATTRGRPLHITLWVLQVLLAVFFVVAAALPKLTGQEVAVQIFDQIGAGQWFRYLVGALELAGGIGLLVPRLAGLAALGLVGVMIGAVVTQLFVLDDPVVALTPAGAGVLLGVVAWGRWARTKALVGALER
jgi:putative oxidoreductase